MADWEINKTLGKCWGTEEEFAVGEDYYAGLVETSEGFERRDYSVGYWDANKPATYCFWKTKMTDPQEKKQLFIDDDMLLAFFERLAEERDPEKLNFRFVLTLVLMRKRKLKYMHQVIEGGKEIWHMRIAGEGRMVTVVNPELTEDKIEELSSQIGQILQVEL
jgi:hypothetical protein